MTPGSLYTTPDGLFYSPDGTKTLALVGGGGDAKFSSFTSVNTAGGVQTLLYTTNFAANSLAPGDTVYYKFGGSCPGSVPGNNSWAVRFGGTFSVGGVTVAVATNIFWQFEGWFICGNTGSDFVQGTATILTSAGNIDVSHPSSVQDFTIANALEFFGTGVALSEMTVDQGVVWVVKKAV